MLSSMLTSASRGRKQMIEIANLSKRYGGFHVLRDCSTRVAHGDMAALNR